MASDGKSPGFTRYAIVAVCMLMGILLYIDRLSFSVAEPYIRQDLGLTKIQTGYCISAFFWFYALGQMPAGWLTDRFGPRLMLPMYILVWSFFTAMIGMVTGLAMLMAMRGAFGLGQAGAFPTGSNVIGRWIPAAGRGGASSLVALGGRIGGAVMPLLTAFLLVNLVPGDKEYTYQAEQMLDPVAIVGKLYPRAIGNAIATNSVDDVSAMVESLPKHLEYVKDNMPSSLVEMSLRVSDDEYAISSEDQRVLAQGFNGIINNAQFYNPEAFASMKSLNRYCSQCIARLEEGEVLTTDETRQFNRFILESIYSIEIEGVYVSSWRYVLYIYGAFGIAVALIVWLVMRDSPREHPWCNEAEQKLIQGTVVENTKTEPFPFKEIIACPSMWYSAMSQFFINVAWLFIVTWFVAFLMEEHNLSIMERSLAMTIPISVGFFGMLLGGLFTDFMARGGRNLRRARALPWGGGALFAAVAFAVCPLLDNPWSITAMMAVVAFSVDFAVPSVWAFTQDVGGKYVGSVLGFGNMFGNFGAAVSGPLLAYISMEYSWNFMFLVCAGVLCVSSGAGFLVDASRPLVPR
ncbi:MAG: MFS transporter [Planctomycetaceae bacterium]|nr:MFS transporter [Planctomycetaceae bacterium]